MKAVTVPGTEEAVEFHCFDTAGQDVYEEMMPQFWEGAKAVVLVYDVLACFTPRRAVTGTAGCWRRLAA